MLAAARTTVRRAILPTGARSGTLRMMSDEADSGLLTINFNLPSESIYSGKTVQSVVIPGAAGEYGVTANHSPIISELKPGVVSITHTDGSEPENFFVPGGFALTHPNSTTDISCPEAVKLDDIDSSVVTGAFESAKAIYEKADDGSIEKAEAQIDMEVNKALGAALGMSL
mmetsp:Transcript_12270/g.26837  ORF Transcript_12270/g.26837 Transcript_12270/m.26837 type:complete len:171 (-) Transcript_12270:130-642(-)|eukprot:CAMPEP_0113306694 /NCGR_PEP_ID=MMETSP0010_2-20120614/5846_1 /TAXON_ID=216773 ORGANISM="Corethron hystrix, Strain 308" /NCGR_SAMPLE_ID=MMETSP0010_2 /ASSEMBLY_ACC=CAM_ASM_000155 /LENGTH=170 /DNA_ID=CAMNT_0000161419 /DNA_START=95 /DNA_END=607 /DNA_ORIENTATION=+ /assembly_acc=CAM_ASM_000155